jgi:hypothetical protein
MYRELGSAHAASAMCVLPAIVTAAVLRCRHLHPGLSQHRSRSAAHRMSASVLLGCGGTKRALRNSSPGGCVHHY